MRLGGLGYGNWPGTGGVSRIFATLLSSGIAEWGDFN